MRDLSDLPYLLLKVLKPCAESLKVLQPLQTLTDGRGSAAGEHWPLQGRDERTVWRYGGMRAYTQVYMCQDSYSKVIKGIFDSFSNFRDHYSLFHSCPEKNKYPQMFR